VRMSSAERESLVQQAVAQVCALHQPLLAARRFWEASQYRAQVQATAWALHASLERARGFDGLLEAIAAELGGAREVLDALWLQRTTRTEIRQGVLKVLTVQGYPAFQRAYEQCMREGGRLCGQERDLELDASFAWTTAERAEVRAFFAELRRLLGAVQEEIKKLKRSLDALMLSKLRRREETSKLHGARPPKSSKPRDERVRALLDALVNCAEV
jgi:hypothetical protein